MVYAPEETPGGCDGDTQGGLEGTSGRDLASCVQLEARKEDDPGGALISDQGESGRGQTRAWSQREGPGI